MAAYVASSAAATTSSPLGFSSMYARDEVKVGEIFKPNTWPGTQSISRAWHFRLQDDDLTETAHKIIFRHSLAAGTWVLIVDGQPHISGFEPILNRKFKVKFIIDGRYDALIKANGRSGMGYAHQLFVNDKEILEMKKSASECLCVGERLPEHVTVPDSRVVNDGVKDITLYQIYIKPFQGGQIMVERRFSEFVTLGKMLSAQKDKHPAPLPQMPSRVFSPWTDQHSSEFIEERRLALQKYLKDLLENARVRHYTEFLCFLGLDPITGDALLQPPSTKSIMFSDDEEEGFPP